MVPFERFLACRWILIIKSKFHLLSINFKNVGAGPVLALRASVGDTLLRKKLKNLHAESKVSSFYQEYI